MPFSNKSLALIAVLVLISVGIWWFTENQPPVPLPISTEDIITSWTYQGFSNDNGEREKAAREKIKSYSSKLGADDDYQMYVAIAQEYDHLGEGKSAYEALSRAIAIDVNETSGVAWHNMGILMEKLGAYHTARVAHEKAIKNEPSISSFQVGRLELMVYHFPHDTAGVEAAFAAAETLLGKSDAMLLDLRKRWKALQ